MFAPVEGRARIRLSFPPTLMPKKSRSKKKSKKVTKRKVKKTAKRRVVRRAKKPAKKMKKVKKPAKKARRAKAVKKASPAKRKIVRAIAEKVIGRVTHYYDRIGVAVVDVQSPIRLGDTIRLRHGDHIFEQRVESLQVNHTPISSAASGQEVGMKVNEVAEEGTVILPA